MENWSLWQFILLISSIILIIPVIIGIFLPLLKPEIKKKSYIYLYSSSAGFILALGTIGLIAQPIFHLNEDLMKKKYSQEIVGLICSAISLGGIITGMMGSLLIRHIIIQYTPNTQQEHEKHNHDEYILNISEAAGYKKKLTVITLLSFHKIPAGFTLGILIFDLFMKNNSNHNIIFEILGVIAFIVHMIPEILVIYYRQIEIKINKWKAMVNTFIIQLIIIPFILIGSYVGEIIENIDWLVTFVLVVSGSVLVFTSIIELIPEFLDQKITHKQWHKTLLLFIIGFAIAIILLMFHTH